MNAEQIHLDNCGRGSSSRICLRLGVWIALVMGVLGMGLPQTWATVKYTIIDLGTLGGTNSGTWGINFLGQVTGFAYLSDNSTYHAFRWTPGGTNGPASNPQMEDLGTLGGSNSQAYGVSGNGQVTGTAYLSDNSTYHAFRWTHGGTNGPVGNPQMEDLGPASPGTNSVGFAIDDIGQVDGYLETGKGTLFQFNRAFFYNVTGQIQPYDPFGGGQSSAAYGNNDQAQSVGWATTANGFEAFLFNPNTNSPFLHLGTFGGNFSTAYAINDNGQIVGDATTAGDAADHAFRYSGSGPMQDLGTLGGTNSVAYGINNLGHVIGTADTSNNETHTFVYIGNGPMQDLNSLIATNSGWTLTFAQGINSGGQIVGTGIHNGQTHGFLLTPVSAVPHDFAVLSIKPPKKIALSDKTPSQIKGVQVSIQNLSGQIETIDSLDKLTNFVSFSVESLGACPVPTVSVVPPKNGFPVLLAPKKKLSVVFNVTFDCSNDDLQGVGHEDFRYTVFVNHSVLDGLDDTAPQNDNCPRGPNGMDKGCGGKNPVTKQLGADVLTDVVKKP